MYIQKKKVSLIWKDVKKCFGGGGNLGEKTALEASKSVSCRHSNADLHLAASLPSRLAAKRVAFTLAEVLITLGIIGVVAALTLPTLIQNYQKQVLVNQLKREVNVISNNLSKILADDEVNLLSETGLFSYDQESEWVSVVDSEAVRNRFQAEVVSDNSKFGQYIKKYFGNDMHGRQMKGFAFKDGSCMAFVNYGEGENGSSVSIGSVILLDVNCDKSPNKIGRDIFALWYIDEGMILPLFGGTDTDTIEAFCNKRYFDTDLDDMNFEIVIYVGGACYAKIVQDGWKMNY